MKKIPEHYLGSIEIDFRNVPDDYLIDQVNFLGDKNELFIGYKIPESGFIQLKMEISGKNKTLYEGKHLPGYYKLLFNINGELKGAFKYILISEKEKNIKEVSLNL